MSSGLVVGGLLEWFLMRGKYKSIFLVEGVGEKVSWWQDKTEAEHGVALKGGGGMIYFMVGSDFM